MMDLQPDRSLIRGLLARGLDVYLVDWGYPDRADRGLTLDDYVNRHLGACIDHVRQASGVAAVNLLGVCQGGTLSICHAALVGTVAEYCARLGRECPSYDESVERLRSLCPHWVVTTSACGRRYRSVSWREPLLGGGEEYFDAGGRLIAAHLHTDYLAYCRGRSFAQTFGTVPTCATKPLTKHLCGRPPPR